MNTNNQTDADILTIGDRTFELAKLIHRRPYNDKREIDEYINLYLYLLKFEFDEATIGQIKTYTIINLLNTLYTAHPKFYCIINVPNIERRRDLLFLILATRGSTIIAPCSEKEYKLYRTPTLAIDIALFISHCRILFAGAYETAEEHNIFAHINSAIISEQNKKQIEYSLITYSKWTILAWLLSANVPRPENKYANIMFKRNTWFLLQNTYYKTPNCVPRNLAYEEQVAKKTCAHLLQYVRFTRQIMENIIANPNFRERINSYNPWQHVYKLCGTIKRETITREEISEIEKYNSPDFDFDAIIQKPKNIFDIDYSTLHSYNTGDAIKLYTYRIPHNYKSASLL